ncbi:peptidoglycan-binding domain-containing protein [Streptomyces parvus]|uniref:Peptidoglycan-binding domain-containing protein n=1 Tax=Streptomyces sp. JL1001 TaxID=3078227 RepID=A0AAU8K8Y5_9ACTN|nr:peptidoglycan-binding domain-containing protein [Streptomyces sp. CB02613]PJN32556.1 Tat pathway signal protein [Streptomyces sp. CB02613]
MRLRTRRTLTALTGAALAGTLALSAAPASAKASDGFVRGYGNWTDDWADEGTLSSTPATHGLSNATCLWQKILWAEGAHNSDGKRFLASDITGKWGHDTTAATRQIQYRWDLTADGIVGPGTFGRADVQLVHAGGSTAKGKKLNLTYRGLFHDFSVVRDEQGKYTFKDRLGNWRQAGYNYRTCKF